jgi:Protein of unknown function (DUF3987)
MKKRKSLVEELRERDKAKGQAGGNGRPADDHVDFQGRTRPPDRPEPEPPQGVGINSKKDERTAYPWPDPPAADAYHGLAGEIVRALEPESESDAIALLVQMIVAFGIVIGRNAHFGVEGDRHFLNLFAVLVGETSKARKGTSWGRIRKFYEQAEPEWASKRILSGLSSGEGLIWNVRDPIQAREKIKQKGRITGFQEYEADPGISDKRLLVHEPEFAIVLRQIERQGNTLSAIIRQAWERGDLRTLTKNSPATATGAHVSIIGHITTEELRRYLSTTEAASGFGNRYLWPLVRRSKCLPDGGTFVDLVPFLGRLSEAIAFGRSAGELRRDDEARTIWHKVYPSLSDGKPGLAGALIARGEAQAMRLACVYALLDQSAVVQAHHLMAALALWEYCERSVRFIFGDSLGDDVADEILSELRKRKEGMTRTEISDHFGRHQSAGRIARALALLQRFGLAEQRTIEGTGGRPAERWFACEGTAKKAK